MEKMGPWPEKERNELDKIIPLVYTDLRRIARLMIRNERFNHTWGTAGLLSEVYMKLSKSGPQWESREHFFNSARQCMERLLKDYARYRGAAKRPFHAIKDIAGENGIFDPADPKTGKTERLYAVHEAWKKYHNYQPRAATVYLYCEWWGLTREETAERMDISASTVTNDYRHAKMWIRRYLSKE